MIRIIVIISILIIKSQIIHAKHNAPLIREAFQFRACGDSPCWLFAQPVEPECDNDEGDDKDDEDDEGLGENDEYNIKNYDEEELQLLILKIV